MSPFMPYLFKSLAGPVAVAAAAAVVVAGDADRGVLFPGNAGKSSASPGGPGDCVLPRGKIVEPPEPKAGKSLMSNDALPACCC